MIGAVGCFVEYLLITHWDIGPGDWDPSGKKGFQSRLHVLVPTFTLVPIFPIYKPINFLFISPTSNSSAIPIGFRRVANLLSRRT